MLSLITVLALFATSTFAGEVCLGPLLQCAHGLKGNFWVINERTVEIREFSYDGKGPAAWFHGQLRPAVEISNDPNKGKGFVTLPFPNGNCDQLNSTTYDNSKVTLILPRSIKEFQTIGILCHRFCHNFGHIIIPEDIQADPVPADWLWSLGFLLKDCPVPPFPVCPTVGQGALMGCVNP